jgi:hypothetical protein
MVVQEQPAELLRQGFSIVTNLPASTHGGDRVLALYRRRDKVEAAFARNQVLPSLRVLASEVMHTIRTHMERISGHGWSPRRLRERLLKAAARLHRSGPRLDVILERRVAALWQVLFNRLQRWPPVPAKPAPLARQQASALAGERTSPDPCVRTRANPRSRRHNRAVDRISK